MKKVFSILLTAAAVVFMTAECNKNDNRHLESDPYGMYIDNVSQNVKDGSVKVGDMVTFDVILQYLDDSAPKGYREVKDDGSVTCIEVTDGLRTDSFGRVKAVSYIEENQGSETITVRLPHGYQDGTDMIRTLKVSVIR